MASVNKVIIVGNLGADPETRYLPSGDAVCNIRVATTDKWKDKASGDMKEQTEWHRITFFGRLAEIAGEYLKKGSQVYVEGSLRTRKYTDKDGVEKYATDIRADTMQMLGSRSGMGGGGDGGGSREMREATEWHSISFFGKLAEIAGQYLKKGSQVYIEGSLKTRKWQGQDGQDRYTTEIVADQMQMLDARAGGAVPVEGEAGPRPPARAPRAAPSAPAATDPGFDDDIPF